MQQQGSRKLWRHSSRGVHLWVTRPMIANMILLHKLQPGGVYFIEDLASGRYLVDGDKQHIIQVGGMGPARARQSLTRRIFPALQRAAAVS